MSENKFPLVNLRYLYFRLGKRRTCKIDLVGELSKIFNMSNSEVQRIIEQNGLVIYAPKGAKWSTDA